MQLNCLGTGGYHPNEVRHTACYLLPEFGVAFDAGTGAFRLPGAVTRPDLHLFLSHPHWDHIIGLTYLLVPMMLEQIKTVDIYANRFTISAIQTHLFAEPTFAHMPDFTFHCLENTPGGYDINGAHVDSFPLASHPGGSVGYRVTADKNSLAYVTDTFVDGSYTEQITGVDLLLHECYFSDEMQDWAEKTGHSFLTQVVRLAAKADVGQLLLIHPDPRIADESPFDLNSAREIFESVEFAQDRQQVG